MTEDRASSEFESEPHIDPRFHSTSLVIWCLAALLPVALTSNPIYLAVSLALACTLFGAVARGSEDAEAWGGFARFGAFFVLLSMAFNLFFGTGGETVQSVVLTGVVDGAPNVLDVARARPSTLVAARTCAHSQVIA